MNRRKVIAIDGPAASGKSTTAKRVAEILGFRHVDSGSLYRAATAAQIRAHGAGAWNERSVVDAAKIVTLRPDKAGFTPVLAGDQAEDEIRGIAVTQNVSRVAQMPAVRNWVNDQVRNAAIENDVVVDGRDIGTAVFPDAELKIFLMADPEERAKRRLLQQSGIDPSEAELQDEAERILRRDAEDARQSERSPDAVIIDTTRLTQTQQVERIVALARKAGLAK